ncbi:sulfurtransferase [Pseudomonas sp. LRF_L74]|uniref:sulfurtransferase n=1 Tax=Pseudomonas sp. LRF_L74 TaxID=3369422 RepID=UPI003F5E533B
MSYPLALNPAHAWQLIQAHADVVVVDLGVLSRYQALHVPGAVHVDFRALLRQDESSIGLLPSAAALAELLSSLGHDEQRTYLFYDEDGSGWVGRFIWTLDVLGHSRYHFIDGGWDAWRESGLPTDATIAAPARTSVALEQATDRVDIDYLLSRLDDPNIRLLDLRPHSEYTGDNLKAARGGHIPGAVHIDWSAFVDEQGRINPAVVERLDAYAIDRQNEIILYCHGFHRAARGYLALKVLGYEHVRGYSGSWSQWGNASSTPVETGASA